MDDADRAGYGLGVCPVARFADALDISSKDNAVREEGIRDI